MESIAVTKPDMGVLQKKHLVLSPFGALAQAFSDELLARNGFEEGQWSFVPLELLREEEAGAPQMPVPTAMKVELNLILQALRRTEIRTQQERTIERVVERIIRIREQSQAKRPAPSGPPVKSGQPGRPRPTAAGGQDAGPKIPVPMRTVNQMSAHHQSFYHTVNQHIHFTANLRQTLSVNQTDRTIRSDAEKSGTRSAAFTRRTYGNREYERTVLAPSAESAPTEGSAPAFRTAPAAAMPTVPAPKLAGWEQEGRAAPAARPRDGRSLTPAELTLPGSGAERAPAQAAMGGLTSAPDREVTRIAHQITRELTTLIDRQDERGRLSASPGRDRERTEHRTVREQPRRQSEHTAPESRKEDRTHAAAPAVHPTQTAAARMSTGSPNVTSQRERGEKTPGNAVRHSADRTSRSSGEASKAVPESRSGARETTTERPAEARQAPAEHRAGMPRTLPEGPGAVRRTTPESPSDNKRTDSVINVWNLIRSSRWLQTLRRRRRHDDDTAKGTVAEGGKERLPDTSDSRIKALLMPGEASEEAVGQKDGAAPAQRPGLGDTVQDIRVSGEGQITAWWESAGPQPGSGAQIPPELTYLTEAEGGADKAIQTAQKPRSDTARERQEPIRRPGGADRLHTREAAGASHAEGQQTAAESGTDTQRTTGGSRPAAAERDASGREAAIRDQPTQADGRDQTQSGMTAGQEKIVPKPGSYARTRLPASMDQDIRAAGEERAASEDGTERIQRSGRAGSGTPEWFPPDHEELSLLLAYAENTRRTDGQPAGGAPAENTKNSPLAGEDLRQSTFTLRDIRLFRAERRLGTERDRQAAQGLVQEPSGEVIVYLTREPSDDGQTGKTERSAVQTARTAQAMRSVQGTKADQGGRPGTANAARTAAHTAIAVRNARTADTAQGRFDLFRMMRSRTGQLGIRDNMTQTRGRPDGQAALPRFAAGGARTVWRYGKPGQAPAERADAGVPDSAGAAPDSQWDSRYRGMAYVISGGALDWTPLALAGAAPDSQWDSRYRGMAYVTSGGTLDWTSLALTGAAPDGQWDSRYRGMAYVTSGGAPDWTSLAITGAAPGGQSDSRYRGMAYVTSGGALDWTPLALTGAAPGSRPDMTPVRPDGSGLPGLADRMPGYRLVGGVQGFPDALAGMPELAFAELGKNMGADPGTRGHGQEARQGQDNTRALPDWARRFLHDGGARDQTEAAEQMRSARSIAALPTRTRQEGISWTAPDYRSPTPIALKERPEPRQAQQPVNARVSDAEIRRTAEKVYQIIEDRIRRERRRLGL